MSSPDRRTVLRLPLGAALLPLLAACGFTPAYGPGGGAKALAGRVQTPEPSDRRAYDLVARLEERLGRGEAAVWRLDYEIAAKALGVGITPDGAVTRYHLTGQVTWRLVRLRDGVAVLEGREDSFTAYSATGSTIAALAAEDDARTRLMRILADRIVTRLIAAAPGLQA
jgi:LPS-assembly lipoprotein